MNSMQAIGPLNITLPPMVLRKLFTTHEEARARLAAAQGGIDDAIVLQRDEASPSSTKRSLPCCHWCMIICEA